MSKNKLPKDKQKKILAGGSYLRMVEKNGWEFFERVNCNGLVVIVAITPAGNIIFTEQLRVPQGRNVIEFPAGLANDLKPAQNESLQTAAKRELLEETGYVAKRWVKLTQGPTSSGSSTEVITLFLARGLQKVGAGGGDHTESIIVHEVPLAKVDGWLAQKQRTGRLIDPKIYAGLYFLQKYNV